MSQKERKAAQEKQKQVGKGGHCSIYPSRSVNCCGQLQEQVKELTQISVQRTVESDSPVSVSVQRQHMGFVFLFAAIQVPAVKAIQLFNLDKLQ